MVIYGRYVEPVEEPVEARRPRPPDSAVVRAMPMILEFFRERPTEVFYLRQVQAHFERPFYHWVTARAVKELVDVRAIKQEARPLQATGEGQVNFLYYPTARYTRRLIQRKLDLIRAFSDESLGRACGRQAEILFSRTLMAKGFRLVEENARAYKGAVWTESGHDLDFIVERDGVGYGCEVKNRFEYIDPVEMRSKVRMCLRLGLRPLFIVRASPKSYIEEARLVGGFTKVFVARIFPFGHMSMVNAIRSELPGLPVDSPRDLPGSILDTFEGWHIRRLRGSTGGEHKSM
jgi:hypothetical protein